MPLTADSCWTKTAVCCFKGKLHLFYIISFSCLIHCKSYISENLFVKTCCLLSASRTFPRLWCNVTVEALTAGKLESHLLHWDLTWQSVRFQYSVLYLTFSFFLATEISFRTFCLAPGSVCNTHNNWKPIVMRVCLRTSERHTGCKMTPVRTRCEPADVHPVATCWWAIMKL